MPLHHNLSTIFKEVTKPRDKLREQGGDRECQRGARARRDARRRDRSKHPRLPDAWAREAGGFPIMTLPLGFLMKDVLFLAASFYLLKQDLKRAAHEITRG